MTFEAGVTDMTPTALRRDGSFAGRRALVVDDNATNLLLMTALLGAWGIETTTAASGEEALGALEGVDLVVLDLMMPGMDGLELGTQIRERVPTLPTILASSIPRHDVLEDPRWEVAGIGAVIVKPIRAQACGAVPRSSTSRPTKRARATHPTRSWTPISPLAIRSGSWWPRTTS
jgi:CheY-like chemotaxis protein